MKLFRIISILFLCINFLVSHAEMSAFSQQVADLARIEAIRIGKTEDSVRIVVDSDKKILFETIALSNPSRIVVTLKNAWLNSNIVKDQPLQSKVVQRIRLGQFDKKTVRLVIETAVKKDRYKIFSMDSFKDDTGKATPFRTVIDLGATPIKTIVEKSNDEKKLAFAKEKEKEQAIEKAKQQEIEQQNKSQKLYPPKEPKDHGKKDTSTSITSTKSFGTLKNKKIVLDPGHGGSDPGAIGPTGVTEKTVTLRVAQDLKKILESDGAKVILTRTKDTEVSKKKSKATDIEELQARCDVANRIEADLFISLHMDSFINAETSGTTTYYYEKGFVASRQLSEALQRSVIKELKTKDRGSKTSNFYVVKNTDVPACLIEMAFISNPKEEKLLYSNSGTQKAAKGIAAGINEYFSKQISFTLLSDEQKTSAKKSTAKSTKLKR